MVGTRVAQAMLCVAIQLLLLAIAPFRSTALPSYGDDVESQYQITQKNYEDEQLPSCRRGKSIGTATLLLLGDSFPD